MLNKNYLLLFINEYNIDLFVLMIVFVESLSYCWKLKIYIKNKIKFVIFIDFYIYDMILIMFMYL